MRQWLRWLALALPFAAIAVGMRVMASSWGRSIARVLYDVTAGPPPDAAPSSGETPGETSVEPLAHPTSDGSAISSPEPRGERAAPDGGTNNRPAPRAGVDRLVPRDTGRGADDGGRALTLFLPAALVEKTITEHGTQIRARTARDTEGKPMGVRLTGIDAARVGLRDGDVIVEIDGIPTPDDDVATDAALGAVAKGKNRIHATLLRGARKVDLTLDLPLSASAMPQSRPP